MSIVLLCLTRLHYRSCDMQRVIKTSSLNRNKFGMRCSRPGWTSISLHTRMIGRQASSGVERSSEDEHNADCPRNISLSPHSACVIAVTPCELCGGYNCASGCVVECRICNWEVAGSNLGRVWATSHQGLLSLPSLRGR